MAKQARTGSKKKQTDNEQVKQNPNNREEIIPIRFAILWHQHQPYYRAGDKFILPWVWLHATKDYLEMARHFERNPKMRGTINLVPSLLKQIEEYLNGEATDEVLELMYKPAAELTEEEQAFMLANFFHANPQTVIYRSRRYHELYDLAHHDKHAFEEQEYRDLAVHYALAWTGEFSREQEPAATLIAKDRDYTEEERAELMEFLRSEVHEIWPLHERLVENGQIELSTTPFYHPILPLLCDTNIARSSTPEVLMPLKDFNYPEEAEIQLNRARQYFIGELHVDPAGCWPSEGSISEEALQLIRKAGFRWTASDEAVLFNSIPDFDPENKSSYLEKYFPRKFNTSEGDLTIFFRDHALSDSIGFTYQTWQPEDAVGDFITRLKQIRSEIIESRGIEALSSACISVILDGENCWEYYNQNGRPFLEQLYAALTSTPEIRPVTFGDVLSELEPESVKPLERLHPGSWINANFNIWIGHPEDNAAWDAVTAAKQTLEKYRARIPELPQDLQMDATARAGRAHEELMIAEGSDWCWWYGDDHFTAQKEEFDELFRMHLRAVYVYLDQRVPHNLTIPILNRPDLHRLYHKLERAPAEAGKEIRLSGILADTAWEQATAINVRATYGAMHRTSLIEVRSLLYAIQEKELLLRIELSRSLREKESLIVTFDQTPEIEFEISALSLILPLVRGQEAAMRIVQNETFDLALPLSHFTTTSLKFTFSYRKAEEELQRFPSEGSYSITLEYH